MTNKDLNNWIMYHEIHRLSRLGFKATRIGRYLGIDRRTVEKRLAMDQQAYERFLLRGQDRPKRLSPYEDFVKSKSEAFADTSTAQMFDWLKERYADLPKVSTRTGLQFCHVRTRKVQHSGSAFPARLFSCRRATLWPPGPGIARRGANNRFTGQDTIQV